MTADRIFGEIGVIATGIIGLAIIAVLVSQRANTANVIKAASSGFGSVIGAAVSPVSGGFGGFTNFGGF